MRSNPRAHAILCALRFSMSFRARFKCFFFFFLVFENYFLILQKIKQSGLRFNIIRFYGYYFLFLSKIALTFKEKFSTSFLTWLFRFNMKYILSFIKFFKLIIVFYLQILFYIYYLVLTLIYFFSIMVIM